LLNIAAAQGQIYDQNAKGVNPSPVAALTHADAVDNSQRRPKGGEKH
jgi:hypothetical protein